MRCMRRMNFLSSWLREDLVEKEEIKKKVNERIREGERKMENREEEKEENATVSAERWCVGFGFCGGL